MDKYQKRKKFIDGLLEKEQSKFLIRCKIFLKGVKDVIFNPITILLLVAFVSMFLMAYFHTQPKKYVGTVVEVSSWDGNARLKTKTRSGKDTILNVHCNKHEQFEVGKVITVWTGGDLFDGIASTKPQH